MWSIPTNGVASVIRTRTLLKKKSWNISILFWIEFSGNWGGVKGMLNFLPKDFTEELCPHVELFPCEGAWVLLQGRSTFSAALVVSIREPLQHPRGTRLKWQQVNNGGAKYLQKSPSPKNIPHQDLSKSHKTSQRRIQKDSCFQECFSKNPNPIKLPLISMEMYFYLQMFGCVEISLNSFPSDA